MKCKYSTNTNRMSIGNRLFDFETRVGENSLEDSALALNPVCASYPGIVADGAVFTMICSQPNRRGRYVAVRKRSGNATIGNMLTLCEVIVYRAEGMFYNWGILSNLKSHASPLNGLHDFKVMSSIKVHQ